MKFMAPRWNTSPKRNPFLVLLSALCLAILSGMALADEKTQDKEELKIQFLLKTVAQSKAVFIRNGEEHPAIKAKEHLEHKMNMARKMFWFFGPTKSITAKEFIEKIAAKSSTTGKKYHIRLASGETVSTETWLKEKLKDYPQKSESP